MALSSMFPNVGERPNSGMLPATQGQDYTDLANQIRQQYGGNWNVQGVDRANELAGIFGANGITDLSKLQFNQGTMQQMNGSGENPADPTTVGNNTMSYGDRTFGTLARQGTAAGANMTANEGDNILARSVAGKGAVTYQTSIGPDGKLRIQPVWRSSGSEDALKSVAMLAALGTGVGALGGAGMLGTAAEAASAGGIFGAGGTLGGLAEAGGGIGANPGLYAGETAGFPGSVAAGGPAIPAGGYDLSAALAGGAPEATAGGISAGTYGSTLPELNWGTLGSGVANTASGLESYLPWAQAAGAAGTAASALDPYGPNSGYGQDTLKNMGATNDTNPSVSTNMQDFFKNLLPKNSQDLKQLFSGIGGLITANQNRNNQGNLANSLKDLYSGNGAYAQNLRNELERRDAASGRRSQYGPREVELQAKLADSASRQAGTLSNIYNQQNGGTADTMQSLYQLFSGLNGFNGLNGLINPPKAGITPTTPGP
jgi:hypothetical protein